MKKATIIISTYLLVLGGLPDHRIDITKRLDQLKPEQISGIYYSKQGIGISTKFSIDRNNEFSFEFLTDDGGKARTKGTYSIFYSHILIYPKTSRKNRPLEYGLVHQFESNYGFICYPINWKNRLYLVFKGTEQDFCNEVNMSIEPTKSFGNFLLRSGDEEFPVDGLPKVPKSWERFLLHKPLNGVVTEVNGDIAKISLGTDSGVVDGMIFVVSEHENINNKNLHRLSNFSTRGLIKVTKANKDESFCALYRSRYFKKLTVSQVITSKLPENLDELDIRALFLNRR